MEGHQKEAVVNYFCKCLSNIHNSQDSLALDAYKYLHSVMRVQADLVSAQSHMKDMHDNCNKMLDTVTRNVA